MREGTGSSRPWLAGWATIVLATIWSGSAWGAECPSGDAPTFTVGDEWRAEGGAYPVVTRVIALEGDGSVVESNADPFCPEGCRYVRDQNLVAKSATNKKGEPAYASGLQLLAFPLQVGKEWDQRLDLRIGSGMSPHSNRWKVEACEEVKVKAGTFRAFRIAWTQDGQRGQGRTQLWTGRATFWWSPDAKAFVKRVAHTSNWGRDWELVSYSLK